MKNKYNVLIIGAGKIAAFYDNPNSSSVITHAHAFTRNENFNLVGFFDINTDKAIYASEIWGGKCFIALEDAFKENTIDVVTIAVPDEYHFDVLKEILNYEPKLILLEKPITKTFTEAQDIENILLKKNTKILVNYSRRFVEKYELIKEEVQTEVYGSFVTGTCYYGKGLIHNGTHAIDLIRYVLGDINKAYVKEVVFDHYIDDPSVSLELTLKTNKTINLQAIDCRNYTIFGMDLLFEKGRIRVEDSDYIKIEKFSVKENEYLNGYRNLVKCYDYYNESDTAMENAVLNIYNHLRQGERLKCTFEDGYKALEVCLNLELNNYSDKRE